MCGRTCVCEYVHFKEFAPACIFHHGLISAHASDKAARRHVCRHNDVIGHTHTHTQPSYSRIHTTHCHNVSDAAVIMGLVYSPTTECKQHNSP